MRKLIAISLALMLTTPSEAAWAPRVLTQCVSYADLSTSIGMLGFPVRPVPDELVPLLVQAAEQHTSQSLGSWVNKPDRAFLYEIRGKVFAGFERDRCMLPAVLLLERVPRALSGRESGKTGA